MPTITNKPITEIAIGDTASFSKTCTEQDVQLFAIVSGDANPVHLDADFAANTQFGQQIAHGMYTGSLVSAALAMELPGPGTIYLGQEIKFKAPVFIGDTITVELTVEAIREDKAIVTLACDCKNQSGKTVAKGTATVIAPNEKISLEAPNLPIVSLS